MAKLRKRLPVSSDDDVFEATSPSSASESRPAPIAGLTWEVSPQAKKSYTVDLREFATGNTRKFGSYASYSGRPKLTEEIAAELRPLLIHQSRRRYIQLLAYLRWFWRFCDAIQDSGIFIFSVADATDELGLLFKAWLLTEGLQSSHAAKVHSHARSLLSAARIRQKYSSTELVWPTIRVSDGLPHKDVPEEALKALYNVLKRQHKAAGRTIAQGRDLLARGVDIRRLEGPELIDAWSQTPNVAFLAKMRLDRITAGVGSPVHPWFDGTARHRRVHPSPPSAGGEGGAALFGTTRWFAPHFLDTCAAFLITLMHFGWNPETVASIDISTDAAWHDLRLQKAIGRKDTVAIYGMKGRTGKEQIAVSLAEPETHPYQIIISMIDRTRHLRDALEQCRAKLASVSEPSTEERRSLKQLEIALKSPWLYLTATKGGIAGTRINYVDPSNNLRTAMNHFCLQARTELAGRPAISPDTRKATGQALATLTPSDLRDGFAAFVYDNSLANILLVKQALGHSKLTSTSWSSRRLVIAS